MDSDATFQNASPDEAWYCIRSQPRRERLAATTLRQEAQLEVCFPRIRFPAPKKGRRKAMEPLFPGYFFAKFDPKFFTRRVKYAHGVGYILTRGERMIEVSPEIIEEIKKITHEEIIDLELDLPKVGEHVRIMTGIFMGESGQISKVIPAKERVQILMEILGHESSIELSIDNIEVNYKNPHSQ